MNLFLRAQDSAQVLTYMLVAFNHMLYSAGMKTAYYPNSGLMNGVVSRAGQRDELSP